MMLTAIRAFIRKHPSLALLLILLALFALAHLLLETQPTPLDSLEAFYIRLADGRPTVVEFYSNH